MKFLIVDSNSILNRAFYGIKLLSTKNGEYTNAVYGFFNIVLKLMDDLAPEEAVFAFDLPAPTFRHKLYDGYKAQRKGMPPELGQQLPVVKELITALGWPVVECEGYEADDILGTLAKGVEEQGGDSLLLTGDRDSLQLVDEHTTVILAATRAGGAQYLTMDPAAVKEKYGVEPLQLIETKALMGDSSDNIPGVAGIGEKTAFSLIQKYGSVERIYQDVEGLEVPAGVKKKLLAGEEMARLSRKLGIICREAPISVKAEDYRRAPMDEGRLCAILSRVGLCAREYISREVDATLSGGEIKRIEIATVLARKSRLWIFDEPEAGIDLWSFQNLIQVFQELRKDLEGAVVVISHQERILSIADELVVISGGRVQDQGPGEKLLPGLLSGQGACAACPGKEDAI